MRVISLHLVRNIWNEEKLESDGPKLKPGDIKRGGEKQGGGAAEEVGEAAEEGEEQRMVLLLTPPEETSSGPIISGT